MKLRLRWLNRLPEHPNVWKTAERLKIDRRIVACAVMAFAEYLDALNPSGILFSGIDEKIIDKVTEIKGFAEAATDSGLILRNTENGFITLVFWADITSDISQDLIEEAYSQAAVKRARERDRKRAYREAKKVNMSTLSRDCPVFVPGTNGGQMNGTFTGQIAGQSELSLENRPDFSEIVPDCPVFVPDLSPDKKEKESFPHTPFKEKENSCNNNAPAHVHTCEESPEPSSPKTFVCNLSGMAEELIRVYPRKVGTLKAQKEALDAVKFYAEKNDCDYLRSFQVILEAVVAYRYHVRHWKNPAMCKDPVKWFADGEYLSNWGEWAPRIEGREWTLTQEDLEQIQNETKQEFNNGIHRIQMH